MHKNPSFWGKEERSASSAERKEAITAFNREVNRQIDLFLEKEEGTIIERLNAMGKTPEEIQDFIKNYRTRCQIRIAEELKKELIEQAKKQTITPQ